MNIKKIVPIVILVAVFIGGVLWRLDEAFYSDRAQTLEFQLRTQVTALSQNFQTEINFWQKVAPKDLKSWPAWQASAEYGKIDETFAWNEGSFGPQTKRESLLRSLKTLSPKGSAGAVAYDVFFDADQKPRAVIWLHQEGHTYFVVTQMESWQGWIESLRGPGSEIFVMTIEGVSLAHGQRDYIGQKATDHPVFKGLAQKADLQQLIQTMKFADQKMYSVVAEKIPNSNLVVVSALPLSDMMAGRNPLRWQIMTLGLGILCLLVGYLVFGLGERPFPQVIERVLLPVSGKKKPEPQEDLSSDEKIMVYKSIAAAVGHELRAPLSAILAMAQSVSTDSLSVSSQNFMQSILRETREARGILDKILGFSGQSVKEKIEMKLESPVRKVLKKLEAQLQSKNVEFKVTVDDQALIPIDQDALMKAFENIILNAAEAMDRQLEKKLTVSVLNDGDRSIVVIEDNGQGMDSLTVDKAKDPFFTTRSFAHHLGLGLSEADGILKEHQAELRLLSNVGKGTRVEIHFRFPHQGLAAVSAPSPVAPALPPRPKSALPAPPKIPSMPPPDVEVEAAPPAVVMTESKEPQPELDIEIAPVAAAAEPSPAEKMEAPAVLAISSLPTEPVTQTSIPVVAKPASPPPAPETPVVTTSKPLGGLKLREPLQSKPNTKLQAPREPENINQLLDLGPDSPDVAAPAAGHVSAEEVKSRMSQMQPPESENQNAGKAAVPKPDIQIERPKSELDSYKVAVRRPGSRSP